MTMDITFSSPSFGGSVDQNDQITLKDILEMHEPFVFGFLKGILEKDEDIYEEDHDEYDECAAGYNYSGWTKRKLVIEQAVKDGIDLSDEYNKLHAYLTEQENIKTWFLAVQTISDGEAQGVYIKDHVWADKELNREVICLTFHEFHPETKKYIPACFAAYREELNNPNVMVWYGTNYEFNGERPKFPASISSDRDVKSLIELFTNWKKNHKERGDFTWRS